MSEKETYLMAKTGNRPVTGRQVAVLTRPPVRALIREVAPRQLSPKADISAKPMLQPMPVTPVRINRTLTERLPERARRGNNVQINIVGSFNAVNILVASHSSPVRSPRRSTTTQRAQPTRVASPARNRRRKESQAEIQERLRERLARFGMPPPGDCGCVVCGCETAYECRNCDCCDCEAQMRLVRLLRQQKLNR